MNHLSVPFSIAIYAIFGAHCDAISKHPIILVTAFDGFRYDYLCRGFTPTLNRIANNGTRAKFMINEFPTITFPNFHSLSTGMHPETHGVIGDSAFNEKHQCLQYGYELYHYNEDIVPQWNLNEFTGDGRHSGVMTWPGSNFKYQNQHPTFHHGFLIPTTWRERVDIIMEWITHRETPANLVYLYFNQPDEISHPFGPDSPWVNDQLRHIDQIVNYLFQRLSDHHLTDKVNTIFLSDHGMVTIKPTHVIDFREFINYDAYTSCGSSPGFQILPKPGKEDEVFANLTAASNRLKTFSVYKPDEIPDRWFFKRNKRMVGFFIQCNSGYVFQDLIGDKGNHGYDNIDRNMLPMFFASGPLIRNNYQIEPFRIIDVFALISHMLKLKQLPDRLTPNGTFSNVISMLKESEK